MLLGFRNLNCLKMNDKELNLLKKIKYLGIVIDRNLTFKDHLNYLEEKTVKFLLRINKLSYLKTNLKIKYKKRLYFSVYAND